MLMSTSHMKPANEQAILTTKSKSTFIQTIAIIIPDDSNSKLNISVYVHSVLQRLQYNNCCNFAESELITDSMHSVTRALNL